MRVDGPDRVRPWRRGPGRRSAQTAMGTRAMGRAAPGGCNARRGRWRLEAEHWSSAGPRRNDVDGQLAHALTMRSKSPTPRPPQPYQVVWRAARGLPRRSGEERGVGGRPRVGKGEKNSKDFRGNGWRVGGKLESGGVILWGGKQLPLEGTLLLDRTRPWQSDCQGQLLPPQVTQGPGFVTEGGLRWGDKWGGVGPPITQATDPGGAAREPEKVRLDASKLVVVHLDALDAPFSSSTLACGLNSKATRTPATVPNVGLSRAR